MGDEDDDEKTLAGVGLKLDRAREEDIAMVSPLSYIYFNSIQSTYHQQCDRSS